MGKTQILSTRRHALLGSGVALALAAMPATLRTAAAHRSIQSGGGIAGGGSVAVQGGGTATFSVFGSRFAVVDEADPLIFGSLTWIDSEGVSLVSSEVTAYGPIEGEEHARQMAGFLAMNGGGRHPFSLKLIDGGGPGEGKDTLTLIVQPSTDGAPATPATGDVVYGANAALTSGDLQILTFDIPE
jgi:hypothetical protein